jgi:hypothetical protein
MNEYDWHLFDAEQGYEVRKVSDGYEIRQQDTPNDVIDLTTEEFEQLRRGGPNPKGLN